MIRRKLSTAEHFRQATEAMSDLYIFSAVVSLLEGGTVHSASNDAAQRIIKICQRESARRLVDHDRHRAHVLAATREST